MFFNWLKGRAARKQAAAGLYQTVRSQSRHPVFYADWGVADTMDGRFDALCLHIAPLLGRLRKAGPHGAKLAQSVFDAMFRDIDQTLRETGVGDLGVPKHMARMMKAFNGRTHVYCTAIDARDAAALETAIARNLYRTEVPPRESADVAAYILSVSEMLGAMTLEDFMRGHVTYPAPVSSAASMREAAYA